MIDYINIIWWLSVLMCIIGYGGTVLICVSYYLHSIGTIQEQVGLKVAFDRMGVLLFPYKCLILGIIGTIILMSTGQ